MTRLAQIHSTILCGAIMLYTGACSEYLMPELSGGEMVLARNVPMRHTKKLLLI